MNSQIAKSEVFRKPKLSGRLAYKEAVRETTEVLAKAQITAASFGKREDIAKEVTIALKKAEKFELNKIVLGLAGYLQSYYYNTKHNGKKGLYYKKIRDHYAYLTCIEEKVDSAFQKFSYEWNATKHSKHLYEDIKNNCVEFSSYLSLKNSAISNKVYVFLITVAYLEKDYEKAIVLCNEILSLLTKKNLGRKTAFYGYIIPALIIEQRFEEGRANIRKAITSSPRNSFNKSSMELCELILEMHAGNYQRAYEVCTKRRQDTNPVVDERWMIAKGVLNFLIRCGKVEAPGHFQLGKFLNEVPLSNLDKAGLNADVYMVYIFLNLDRGKGKLIDRQEALEKYVQRHLKGRTRTFFKMLLSIIKYGFNPEVIAFRNEDNIKKLKKQVVDSDEIMSFEFVPYEILWQFILDYLEDLKK